MSGLLEIGGKPFEALAARQAGKKQRKADKEAMERQLEAFNQARRLQTELGREGADLIGQGGSQALGALGQFGGASLEELQRGETSARGFAKTFADRGIEDARAGGALAQSQLEGAQQTLADFASGVDLNAPIEADAGFQFQMDQALKGVNAGFSARGGRLGGRAAKALQDRAQGVAATHANDVFARRHAQRGQDIGVGRGLAGIQQGQAALSANQGNALAAMQTNLGNNLAGITQGGATQIANTLGGLGANIGNVFTGTAAGQANALQNLAAAQANITSQQVPLYNIPRQTAGIDQLAMLQAGAGINQGIGSVGGVVENAVGQAVGSYLGAGG